MFRQSFKDISRKFQGCFKEVSRVFQGSFRSVFSKVLVLGCFEGVLRVFQGSFKKTFKGNMHQKHDVILKDVFLITYMTTGIYF